MARWVIIFALICVATVYATKTCTTATGGVPCGDHRKCPSEGAVCSGGQCKCSSGKGVAGLDCGGPTNKMASNINDPISKNFNNETAAVDLPCAYLFADVTTNVNSGMSMLANAKCHIKVEMVNQRIDGKQYVSQIKVHFETEGFPTNQNYKYKVDGQGEDGEYCFWRKVKPNADDEDRDWENPGDDLPLGPETIAFDIDYAQNKVKIDAPFCGFTLQYRPADKTKNVFEQPYVPGAVIKLSNVHSYNNDDKTIALDPSDTFSDLKPSGWSNEDLLLYRAIKSGADQSDHKWRSGRCGHIESVFDDCDDNAAIGKALDYCGYALRNPSFMRCYSDFREDDKSGYIIKLFEDCVSAICREKKNKCQQVVDKTTEEEECSDYLTNEPIMADDACEF